MTTTKTAPAEIFATAAAAAKNAVAACTPTPMIVGTPTNFFSNDIDYTKPVYNVSGGVCGFAYVTIRPARGAFVGWLKKQGMGYNGYYGGWQVPAYKFAEYGQSMERGIAAAKAAANILTEAGITAYVESRMD